MKKIFNFVLLAIFINTFSVQAATITKNSPAYQKTNSQISTIINKLNSKHFTSFSAKVAYINQLFFNKPYAFNALGEGKTGEFDDNPLYRIDAFDCETYVDTVIALALATDLQSFQGLIRKIRYKDGNVSFINRNHFTCLDWNKNNQKQGITKDITNNIKDKQNNSIAKQAKTYIDKPNWYKNMPIERIRQQGLDDQAKDKKLSDLRKRGSKLKKTMSTIAYIPLNKIFFLDDKVDKEIIKQIPNGAIIEIIRPNWDLCKVIGTHLNVSHLGFVVWKNDKPYFIHASSDKLMIVKTSLIEYLKIAKENPSIKGINIQIITPNT